ncbi:MAG TPA: hypothetical protein VGJ22_02320 [Anaerolineales bacterium]|jgi:hypothetical protein
MGGRKSQNLLEKAKASPYGWRRPQLVRLYERYGFAIENGAKHDIVKHPLYPELRATLTRSSAELHPDYVRHALDMIRKLTERQKEGEPEE